jgi:hypothetical protein
MTRCAPQVVDYQQLTTKCILGAFFSCVYLIIGLLYVHDEGKKD